MKQIKQLKLNNQQLTTILNHLYDLYPLPNNCIVAGQSVSTLIDQQVNGDDYFSDINDIDCFFPSNFYEEHELTLPVEFTEQWVSKEKENNTTLILNEEVGSFGGFEGMQLASRDDNYHILGTERDQLGNHILFGMNIWRSIDILPHVNEGIPVC